MDLSPLQFYSCDSQSREVKISSKNFERPKNREIALISTIFGASKSSRRNLFFEFFERTKRMKRFQKIRKLFEKIRKNFHQSCTDCIFFHSVISLSCICSSLPKSKMGSFGKLRCHGRCQLRPPLLEKIPPPFLFFKNWMSKKFVGCPKNVLDVQKLFWTSKKVFGRPKNVLDVPKKILDVQKLFWTSKKLLHLRKHNVRSW